MSPRKTILRELSQAREQGAERTAFSRPSTISGFVDEPDKYHKAVNELLQSRLVEGRKDEEGHMTIALNSRRLQDVRRELRPIWARPTVWTVIAILLAVGAGLAV